MTQDSKSTEPTIIPYFGYQDAGAALLFLEQAFGFHKTKEYRGDDGKVMHAEMSYGNGVIMLGTGTDEQRDLEKVNKPPSRGIYIVVRDLDSHFEQAKSAGARIVWEPHDTEFGTRRYRVMDPEGYEWSFGTYQPSGNS